MVTGCRLQAISEREEGKGAKRQESDNCRCCILSLKPAVAAVAAAAAARSISNRRQARHNKGQSPNRQAMDSNQQRSRNKLACSCHEPHSEFVARSWVAGMTGRDRPKRAEPRRSINHTYVSGTTSSIPSKRVAFTRCRQVALQQSNICAVEHVS